MIQLYYAPSTASLIPHLLLREMGIPFELVLVDRAVKAQKSPEFIALNPNGLVPVLKDGELVIYETAAICLYLCDTYGHDGLVPAIGTAERASFYKWLIWLTNTMQSTLMAYFNPGRWVAEGNEEGAAQVKTRAQEKVYGMLDQLDAELQSHGGDWFMGNTFTALDIYVFIMCRWTRGFSSRPAREYPHLAPYLQRMLARPATQSAFAAEKLSEPFV
jgi:glutathione S-transferase